MLEMTNFCARSPPCPPLTTVSTTTAPASPSVHSSTHSPESRAPSHPPSTGHHYPSTSQRSIHPEGCHLEWGAAVNAKPARVHLSSDRWGHFTLTRSVLWGGAPSCASVSLAAPLPVLQHWCQVTGAVQCLLLPSPRHHPREPQALFDFLTLRQLAWHLNLFPERGQQQPSPPTWPGFQERRPQPPAHSLPAPWPLGRRTRKTTGPSRSASCDDFIATSEANSQNYRHTRLVKEKAHSSSEAAAPTHPVGLTQSSHLHTCLGPRALRKYLGPLQRCKAQDPAQPRPGPTFSTSAVPRLAPEHPR